MIYHIFIEAMDSENESTDSLCIISESTSSSRKWPCSDSATIITEGKKRCVSYSIYIT